MRTNLYDAETGAKLPPHGRNFARAFYGLQGVFMTARLGDGMISRWQITRCRGSRKTTWQIRDMNANLYVSNCPSWQSALDVMTIDAMLLCGIIYGNTPTLL